MECAICMLPMNPGTFTTTLCNHNFHKNCLCAWFNSRIGEPATCPLCRTQIEYDRGIVEYWDPHSRKIKNIQNSKGNYGFYYNGKKKYYLEIDRRNDNKIIGGIIYGKFRFDNIIKLNSKLIQKYRKELDKMQTNENYDIREDIRNIAY